MVIPNVNNIAILFLDLQDEIVKNSQTLALPKLRLAVGGLAKLAAVHKLPVFLSAVPSGGSFLTEVSRAFPNIEPSMRTHTTAFADQSVVNGLKECGRMALVVAGVASEIVVQRTALDAIAAGYDVLVAVDACGGVDPRTEEAAWRRIIAAGGVTTSAITLAAELTGDFTTEQGGETLAIMYELLAAN